MNYYIFIFLLFFHPINEQSKNLKKKDLNGKILMNICERTNKYKVNFLLLKKLTITMVEKIDYRNG